MGKFDIYLAIIGLFTSISTASFAPKGHPVGGLGDGIIAEYHPTADNDESSDSGPADENEPKKDRRVLQSGDTLTPPELLPLAKRLIAQVDTIPGGGKGIISSAPSAEVLADILFQAFFMKERRIAELTKYDISGLDALQALALNGEGIQKNLKLVSVDGGRCYVDELNNNGVVDNNMCYADGPEPRKSIYKLLTKPSDSVHENSIPTNREKRETGVAGNIPQSRIALINKLGKKRRLVVNTGRKHDNTRNQNNNIEIKVGGTVKGSNAQRNVQQVNIVTPRPLDVPVSKKANLKGCRWRFECSEPKDLDTCRLRTFCPNNGILQNDDEHERALQRVRRMIGISPVDEEVEKILESRALKLRAKESFGSASPPETLSQYLTNLIMRQVVKVDKLSSKNKNNIGTDTDDKTDSGNVVSLDMVTSDETNIDENKSNYEPGNEKVKNRKSGFAQKRS